MAKCTGTNGTYSCQFELGKGQRHTGMHYAYYANAEGLARVAYWLDKFGQVQVIKAPVPDIPRNGPMVAIPDTPPKHDYEPGDTTKPMQSEPLCRICGGYKRSAFHS